VNRDFFRADYIPETCTQCEYPACYYVCPVRGALIIDEKTGARVIMEDVCIGCGACSRACPYNARGKIIRYNPEKKKYFKCDLCSGNPQCVEACRWMALKYA
jgi:Fe-S-cluster-containing dehydrogenase component